MFKTSILISLIGLVLQCYSVRCAAISVPSSGESSPSNQANGLPFTGRNSVSSQYNSNPIPNIPSEYRSGGFLDASSSIPQIRIQPSVNGFNVYPQQPNQLHSPSPYQYNPYNSFGNVPTFSYYGQPNANQIKPGGMHSAMIPGMNANIASGMAPFGNQPPVPPYLQMYGHQASFGPPPQFGQSSQLPATASDIFSRSNLSKNSDEKSDKSSS